MAAFFTVLVLPFIYSYDEALAVLLFEIFSVSYFLYNLLKYGRNLKLNKTGCIFIVLCGVWYFTVVRSVVVSLNQDASFEVLFKLTALVLLAFGLAISFLFDRKKTVEELFASSMVAGFIHGFIALNEYIEASPIPDTWLDPMSKDIFRTRCAGIFTDPNVFAAYLSVVFIFTIGWIICSKSSFKYKSAAISLIFCGFGIFSTLSRGGWIALAAGFLIPLLGVGLAKIYYYFRNIDINYADISGLKSVNSISRMFLLVSFSILAIIFFVMPFKNRLFTIAKPSDMTIEQRSLIAKGIFANIRKFPVAGHGLQNFNLVYPQYRAVGGDYPLYCHNEFIQSMIETGFMSSIIMILICFYASKTLFLSVVASNKDVLKKDLYNKIYNMLFASAFIVLLVHNISGFSSRMLPTAILISICFGFVFSFGLTYKKEKDMFCLNKTKYILFIIAFIYISFCVSFYVCKNMLNAANQLKFQGKYKEAEVILKRLVKLRPNNSFIVAALGNLYENSGMNNLALEMYKKAASITPAEASFYEEIAILSEDSDPKMADEMYKQTLELDPAAEYIRIEYVKFLIKYDKLKEAKEVLTKGLEYSPGFHNVYKGYALMEEILKAINN